MAVLLQMSCLSCPVPAVLSCHVPSTLVQRTLLSLLTCSGCPFLAFLSWVPCHSCFVLAPFFPLGSDQASLARLTCPSFLIPNILPWLSRPGCATSVLPVLSQLFCPGCPVLVILSSFLVSGVLSLMSCPGYPHLSVLSLLTSQADLF
jgi:hypothetical protein